MKFSKLVYKVISIWFTRPLIWKWKIHLNLRQIYVKSVFKHISLLRSCSKTKGFGLLRGSTEWLNQWSEAEKPLSVTVKYDFQHQEIVHPNIKLVWTCHDQYGIGASKIINLWLRCIFITKLRDFDLTLKLSVTCVRELGPKKRPKLGVNKGFRLLFG